MVQIGIALVGMSSLLGGEGSAQVEVSPSKMLLGMGLIVASQVSAPSTWVVLISCRPSPLQAPVD